MKYLNGIYMLFVALYFWSKMIGEAFPNIDRGAKTIRIKGFTSVITADFQGNLYFYSEVPSDSNITLSVLYYSCFFN